jgi:pimeloyl-ACP methyl ester carboxylesterase
MPGVRTTAFVFEVAALLFAAAVSACSPGRAIESLQVMRGLSEPEADRPAPARRLARGFEVAGRKYAADLYVPEDGAEAALVLVPGVVPRGKDDPRLVAFAGALSRARFLVLVPDIENLRDLKVGPGDITAIGDAVVHLAELAGGVEVGLVAISYSAGPALIAATEDGTRSSLRFLLAIGGYYDIEAVVTFFTTGGFRGAPEAAWEHMEPNPYGKWIFLKSNLHRIADPGDRSLLREMAERKLRDPQADIGDLAVRLGGEGRAVHALLSNRDPERVPALIAALPEAIRSDMRRLSPRLHDLSPLAARLILVHGRDDPVIPFTESKALRDALPDRSELHIVRSLAHVDLSPLGALDVLTLWRATYRLLQLRDDMPRPKPVPAGSVAAPALLRYG